MGIHLYSHGFYRNQFPLSSSTHRSLCILINAHTSRPQSTGNAQNTGNTYQQQRTKITSSGETEHGFLVFFSQKPNKLFCLVSVKKTQQTRFGLWEKWVWGFWFSMYGLPGEIDWEGNGVEGRLQLKKRMSIRASGCSELNRA
ncbi:hypothetical protein NC652_018727 [Populus alba x Populus x berolinensis]|nr:hypothetical protein NC652_018727 [Populus alba x Populus x berolinensis]